MAAEVSIQHGIRLDADDPMMAVVTLNRLVFEQAVAECSGARSVGGPKDFEAAADKVQVRAWRRPRAGSPGMRRFDAPGICEGAGRVPARRARES